MNQFAEFCFNLNGSKFLQNFCTDNLGSEPIVRFQSTTNKLLKVKYLQSQAHNLDNTSISEKYVDSIHPDAQV